MLNGIKKAIFFGAHTDDEMVCAGTLHRLVRQGTELHMVAFAPAAIESDRLGGLMSIRVVEKEWYQSVKVIGAQQNSFLCHSPSVDLSPFRQQICQYIFDLCESVKPDCVISLSPEDENTAHRIVGEECDRVIRGRVPLFIRCQYPWNFSIGKHNLFVELGSHDIESKVRVIECYQSQKFRYNYLGLFMAQATADGLSAKVGTAEKFEIVRAVVCV